MLRAAVCPWRSATTQCSTRMRSPVSRSGQRAMSPAAKMPGMLLSRYSSTMTPRSIASPACSANESDGPHADPDDDEVGLEAVLRSLDVDALLVYRGGRRAEVERHAMVLMELAQELSDLRSQNFLHQNRLGPDHVDFDIPGTKRRCDLKADEARADYDRALATSDAWRQEPGCQRAVRR